MGVSPVAGEEDEEVGIPAWIAWTVLFCCSLIALGLYHIGKRYKGRQSSWSAVGERRGKDTAAAASPPHNNNNKSEQSKAVNGHDVGSVALAATGHSSPLVIAVGGADTVTRRADATSNAQPLAATPTTSQPVPPTAAALRARFEAFRRQYLLVWMLCVFTEFLKGPYTVPLYVEYGLTLRQMAMIFITGALASLVLGTTAGALADHVGRAYMCRWFCIIHGLSMLSKLSPRFAVLMAGRVLDGLALSLQFTAFEAWMVTAHHLAGFDAAWLQETFAIVSCSSGAVAVMAGLWAEAAVYLWGNLGPFLSTLPLLVIALYHMRHWSENYGQHVLSGAESTRATSSTSSSSSLSNDGTESDNAETSVIASPVVVAEEEEMDGGAQLRHRVRITNSTSDGVNRRPGRLLTRLRRCLGSAGQTTFCSLRAGWRSIRSSPRLQLLGSCEILYESSFSVWCFCWAPLLGALTKHSSFGLIFASFMICMMIGGLLARLCPLRVGLSRAHEVAVFTLAVAALLHRHKTAMYLTFLGFEVSSGMFSAVHPTLRSSWTLDDHRSAVLNLFRAPANVMAFVLLGIGLSLHHLLYVAVVLQVGSLLCMYRLRGDVR